MKDECLLSIIIPTFNEEKNIVSLINYLTQHSSTGLAEIIIADGQSTDDTVEAAIKSGVRAIICPKKGRASQMNYGALHAAANVLYFLHADSYPPPGFATNIAEQINNGYGIGCFRLQFDKAHWFLKANAWFTRFDIDAFRFGDQSLFVLKDVFTKAGGFNEKLIVMEDQEIIHRLKRFGKFRVMRQSITTSARKYTWNGTYKMQVIFFLIYLLYKAGVSQNKLVIIYRKLIKQDKV